MEIIRENKKERVIIVGTDIGAYPHSLDTSLYELEELVKAAGGEVVGVVTQNMTKFNPKYLIGSGKVHEIKVSLRLEKSRQPHFSTENVTAFATTAFDII